MTTRTIAESTELSATLDERRSIFLVDGELA